MKSIAKFIVKLAAKAKDLTIKTIKFLLINAEFCYSKGVLHSAIDLRPLMA